MPLSDMIGGRSGTPASKQERLFRQLIRLAIRSGIALVIMGGFAFGLSTFEARKEEARNAARNEASNMSSQVVAFEQKLSKAEKAVPIFVKMKELTGKPELPLDRMKARGFLDGLAEAYMFSGLRATLAPVRELDNTYKNASVQGIACDMTLTFEGMSDEHVFALIGDMRKHYLGLIKIMGVTVSRTALPDAAVLKSIAQNGKVTLVKGDVKLQWLGIKSLKVPPPSPTTPPPSTSATPAAPPALAPGAQP